MPILGIFMSMLVTGAIGGLLAHYHKKPVFDWHGVTLNAIVSTLATISKALLVFTLDECLGQAKWIWLSQKQQPLNDLNLIDQASRGPLGCCEILRSSIARSFITMGAITIILSTAMDPFFQLSIGKKGDVKYEESSNAQISYAKRYSKGSFDTVAATIGKELPIIFLSFRLLTRPLVLAADGSKYLATEIEADFDMKSAVLSGLSQPDAYISQQTQHSCPVGNCTWDTFRSLAVCSACNDLTNRIVTKDMGVTSPLAVYLARTNPATYLMQVTEYQLPNGLRGDSSTLMTAFGTGNSTESITFASHDTLIWSMTMMNITEDHQPSSIDSPPVKVSAIECGLWYCVNAYTPAVKNGKLTEIVRPSPPKRNVDSWQPITGSLNGHGTATPHSINYDGITSSVQRTDLQLDEGFNISQAAVYGISKLMNDTFAVPPRSNGINAYVLRSDNNTYIPTVMQSLYKSHDLNATFASLAKSMTNNIRQNDDDSSVMKGQAGTYLLLIRVRFWFLTLPIIVTLVAAVFLGTVIRYTHTSDLEVWTTNALPVVAFGRTLDFAFDAEKNMTAKAMEKNAKKKMVQFGKLDELGQFSSTKRTSTFRQHGGYEMITN